MLVSNYSMGGWLCSDPGTTPARIDVKEILESVRKNSSSDESSDPEIQARTLTIANSSTTQD